MLSSQVTEFVEGEDRWRTVGERLCGREVPEVVNTTTEKVRVTFRSDAEINGDGFKGWPTTYDACLMIPPNISRSSEAQ